MRTVVHHGSTALGDLFVVWRTKGVRPSTFKSVASRVLLSSRRRPADVTDQREVVMSVWAWVLIIVLLVLLLTGGVYVRR